MPSLFKKQSVIGIDISDYSIEVLQLNEKREVLTYGRLILEEDIIHNGKILEKEKLVAKLEEVLRGTKPTPSYSAHSTSGVILSLPESKTFIHLFKIPKDLTGQELKQAVYKEALKIIPVDQEKIYWDFQVLSPDKDYQRVLYTGTLKEIVSEYIDVLSQLDLKPIAFDLETASLARALIKQSKVPMMIIDIGARTTLLGIFDSKGVLNLSITIPIAGNHFTKAVADTLKIKNDKAEKLKRTFGFSEKKTSKKISSILKASFQKVLKEIEDTIHYYEESSGESIEEIILAGGSALLPEIDHYLASNLKKKVSVGNPLKKISPSTAFKAGKKNPPILFANVIGLALRGISARPSQGGFNL